MIRFTNEEYITKALTNGQILTLEDIEAQKITNRGYIEEELRRRGINGYTIRTFLGKLDVPYDLEEECWIFTGYINSSGYGQFCYLIEQMVHRVSIIMFTDEDIKDKHTRHKCDTRNCTNIFHLETGTNADNVRDKVKRGRQLRGEDINTSILTESNVRYILIDSWNGKYQSMKQIANEYCVHIDTIRSLFDDKNWKHIVSEVTTSLGVSLSEIKAKLISDCRGENCNLSKLTENDIRQIRKLIALGWSNISIAQQFNVTPSVISKIKLGLLWKYVI